MLNLRGVAQNYSRNDHNINKNDSGIFKFAEMSANST